MATHFHPFMNSFALAQEANIPLWALIEHAAASGMVPQGFCNPGNRSSARRHCPRAAQPQEPQSCSSRQSQQQQCRREQTAAPSENQGVSFQDFIASAAAIAKTILGEEMQTEQPAATPAAMGSQKAGEVLSATNSSESGFEVKLDVSNFSPAELNVKTVENAIVIEAKHEQEDAHGFVSRSFSRRYVLPEGVKADSVTCKLASNGVLILSAPVPTPVNERSIPINFTGVPASVSIPEAPAGTAPIPAPEQVENNPTAADEKEVPMSMEQEEAKLD